MKFKSISTRIFILVIPTIIITILLFAILSYYESNIRINKTINEKMQESLQVADVKMQMELYKNAAVSINFANYAKVFYKDAFSHERHKSFLTEGILSNKNTTSGGIWFEPYAFDSNEYYLGLFLYADDKEGMVYVPEYGSYVNYFDEDWYIKGKESNGELVWSKVYLDVVSNVTMVTATKAFYNDEGEFLGVGTADMNLETIREIVNSMSVGETGRAFVLGSKGEYISFYDEGKSANDTMQTDEEEVLAQLGNELLENETGIATLIRNGEKLRVYYMTMDNVNWTLAMVFEEREINSSALTSFFIMTIIPIIGLLLVILAIVLIVKYLQEIIHKVNNFADLAASGDFSKRIEVTENDEFGLMEQNLNKMIENMNEMQMHSAKLLKVAETASNSKSEFLSRMSHEIRTPMNAIMGMTQIAKSSHDVGKMNTCLVKIENASEHLLSLINDILDMSKIETNRLGLEEEAFDFKQTLENLCDMMLVKAEEKNQKLVLHVDENMPSYIVGDELRISQVIMNLVGNAVKFTPEDGSISVTVEETKKEDEYSVIRVSVTDSGIGLSKEQRAKLFQSFEQGDGSISRKFGGTGLGLAISRRIVEMMGGDIEVLSEPDKGSTFVFEIHVLRVQCVEKKEEKQSKVNLVRVDFTGNTILLAEDVNINREIVSALLEDTKVEIVFAENGIQAVEMFCKEPERYDLILMDIQMPEMDGFEATRKIRQMNMKRAKTIPIIAMTANVFSEDIIKCKEVGMNDHIAKPIDSELLLITLNDYLLMKDYLNRNIE